MAVIVFNIVRSHYFVDFALKLKVYDRLVDLWTYVDFFTIKILILMHGDLKIKL